MAKQKRSSQTSMNDIVGQRKGKIGEPKKFFGSIPKIATGKDADGNLIFSDEKHDGVEKLDPKAGFAPVLQINDKALIEQEERSKAYNNNLYELNPKYSKLVPLHEIMVRCKVIEPYRTQGGLIVTPVVKVDIPSNTGHGKIGEVDSPYPYSKQAVIVAVPPTYANNPDSPFKPGATVMLGASPLRVLSKDKDGVSFDMPAAFTHPEWDGNQPPTNMENEHYGYLMVSFRDCRLIVPKNYLTDGEEDINADEGNKVTNNSEEK